MAGLGSGGCPSAGVRHDGILSTANNHGAVTSQRPSPEAQTAYFGVKNVLVGVKRQLYLFRGSPSECRGSIITLRNAHLWHVFPHAGSSNGSTVESIIRPGQVRDLCIFHWWKHSPSENSRRGESQAGLCSFKVAVADLDMHC